jgi:hypothetical protein
MEESLKNGAQQRSPNQQRRKIFARDNMRRAEAQLKP